MQKFWPGLLHVLLVCVHKFDYASRGKWKQWNGVAFTGKSAWKAMWRRFLYRLNLIQGRWGCIHTKQERYQMSDIKSGHSACPETSGSKCNVVENDGSRNSLTTLFWGKSEFHFQSESNINQSLTGDGTFFKPGAIDESSWMQFATKVVQKWL